MLFVIRWFGLFIAASLAAAPPAGRPAVELLETGVFHGGEVAAQNGERWTGLYKTPRGFAWRATPITIRRVEDPIGDQPGAKTGIQVGATGSPLFLVKGLTGLIGRAVRPAQHEEGGMPLPVGPLRLECPGGCGVSRLTLTGRVTSSDAAAKPSQLILESGGVSQVLYEWPEGLNDQHCELVWAGDLDGDGRLDLLMVLSGHDNVMERTLFLSSKRPRNKLVERVAVFSTKGC